MSNNEIRWQRKSAISQVCRMQKVRSW